MIECQPITIELLHRRYFLEFYGAYGGTGLTYAAKKEYHGGYGAYASGILNLKEKMTFYLYIGGKVEVCINSFNTHVMEESVIY